MFLRGQIITGVCLFLQGFLLCDSYKPSFSGITLHYYWLLWTFLYKTTWQKNWESFFRVDFLALDQTSSILLAVSAPQHLLWIIHSNNDCTWCNQVNWKIGNNSQSLEQWKNLILSVLINKEYKLDWILLGEECWLVLFIYLFIYVCIHVFISMCLEQKNLHCVHQGVNMFHMTKLSLNWLLRLKWIYWLKWLRTQGCLTSADLIQGLTDVTGNWFLSLPLFCYSVWVLFFRSLAVTKWIV